MFAHEYPVTFPYGATSAPYGTPAFPYHRGNDRATPSGTEIRIGNTVIGKTGNTGMSSGPHLHTQEWQGSSFNDRKPLNEFKGGIVTQVNPTNTGQWGKYVTIQNADGWYTTYAHLSETNVIVGQRIEEQPVIEDTPYWRTVLRIINSEVGHWNFDEVHAGKFDQSEMNAWKGRRLDEYVNQKWKEAEKARAAEYTMKKEYPALKAGNYTKLKTAVQQALNSN